MTAVVLLLGWTRQESRMIFTVRAEWQGFWRQGTNVLKWQASRSHPRIVHSNYDTSALASAGPTVWNLMLALHLLTCCIRHTTSGLPTTWSLGAQDGQLDMISHLCQLAVWQYETPVYNQKHAGRGSFSLVFQAVCHEASYPASHAWVTASIKSGKRCSVWN